MQPIVVSARNFFCINIIFLSHYVRLSVVGYGHTMSSEHFSPTDRPTHDFALKNWNGNSCKRSYITEEKSRRVSSPKKILRLQTSIWCLSSTFSQRPFPFVSAKNRCTWRGPEMMFRASKSRISKFWTPQTYYYANKNNNNNNRPW